ncbi:MAG: AAA family ATPase [Campylobacteraceae bacterium]|nr:AAA family ATPase [Campylobacteraceae bacterium]
MKIESIHIDQYKVLKNFDISFLDHNNKVLDLIVLAGINGSGKTSLFEYIMEVFQYRLTEIKDKIKINTPDIPLALYFKNTYYIEAKDSKNEIEEEIIRYIEEQIFEKELSAKEAYNKVRTILDQIFDGLNIQIKFSKLDRDKNIFFENNEGKKIHISSLSTGEKELLNKIFYLFVADIKDSVILIDEPEISLHPSWQNRVIKIYKNFAKSNNNQIIIATHSPQIVASTPNERLRVLIKENNTIKAYSPDAYGMEVNKALTDIMGVNELRDIEVEYQYDKVKNLILKNKYSSESFKIELDKLEKMMQNDKIDFGLLKLEILKREKNDSSK